jgi:hypothetical protein
MRRITEEQVDDFRQVFLDHSWQCPGSYPVMTWEQTEELLGLAVPWVLSEFTPKRAPVSQQKSKKIDKGSQSEGRTVVYGRSGRRCEIQVEDVCTGRASQWHHRLDRQQGGTWHASNGLDACSSCHLFVTNERTVAKRFGWAVEWWRAPSEVPVFRRGEWVYLDDEGGLVPAVEGGVA